MQILLHGSFAHITRYHSKYKRNNPIQSNPKDPRPRPFHKLQILSLPSNKLLSSVSSLSSSSRLSSDSLKSSSLLLGLEGRSCAEEVDSSKDIISDLSLPKACRVVGRKKVKIGPKRLPCGSVLRYFSFYSRASTDFWSADCMAIISLESATTICEPSMVNTWELKKLIVFTTESGKSPQGLTN